MKHLFVIAALLFVQNSAFAQARSAPAVNPEPTSKQTCWKKNASDGTLATQQQLIRPATYMQDTTRTLERAARSQRTI